MRQCPLLLSLLFPHYGGAVVRRSHAASAPEAEELYVWSDGSDGGPEGLVQVDARFSASPPAEEQQRRLAQHGRQILSGASDVNANEDLSEGEDLFEQEDPLALGAKGNSTSSDWKQWKRKTQLVMPESKLAFCYIPKVGSAQMTRLFDLVNGVPEGWQSSAPSKLGVKWNNVTKEEGWKFAFFTRDPLSRYLSAFGSKCMVNTAGVVEGTPPGTDCKGKILWTPVSLDVAVATFEERVFNDSMAKIPSDNPHWWSMMKIINICGNRFNPYTVDFKGDLDADVHTEVESMLEMANVPNASGLAERFFPQNQVAGHSSRTESRLQTFYRSRAVVQAVANLYALDYVQLSLPLPEKGHPWISTYRPTDASKWDVAQR